MRSGAKPRNLNARLDAVLFESDSPDVVLLSRKQGNAVQHYLACSIPDEEGYVDFYFAVFVGRSHLIRYFNDQCDLRFLFTYASGRRFYHFKHLVRADQGNIKLEEYSGVVTEDMIPDSKFFASAHTSSYGLTEIAKGEQRLLIDGGWDMQEFGAFYQKFADIYSYQRAIKYMDDGSETRSARVEAAFASKPFRGGSSYMGFFDDLFGIMPREERPVLDGIVYHSPGHVDLRGKPEILDGVRQSIEGFLAVHESLQSAHDDLKSYMSKSGLLSVTGRGATTNSVILGEVQRLSSRFFEILPITGKEYLLYLTKGNVVVHAKVGLALYRRLRITAQFFAQGRLSFD